MKIDHRSFHYAVMCLTFLCAFYSCNSPEESEQNTEKWTSSDPLDVHYRLREQKYLRGNLIENPSFEQGKIRKSDSLSQQTSIDGWEIIGNNVRWIRPDKDSVLTNPGEVHTGKHSICIQRKQADENEELGQGVLSDYIKVIPGNYELTLFLDLKDIHNPKSRLGTKIFDAVDIRVLYYDRNKLQIKGELYSPYYNTTVNTSFKGMSFANFDFIDSTGWIHVAGRSQLFPFPDGDLPDNTKFIRVFIGLKGTGTLWADDVCLDYTPWNFTAFERLQKYSDSAATRKLWIVPKPRTLTMRETKIYYRPFSKNCYPSVVIPLSADKVTINSAMLLERKIKDLLIKIENIDSTKIPRLIKRENEIKQDDATLIFSIGGTTLFERNKNKLPINAISDRPQGYFIHTIDALSNIIFIYGNTSIADYYGVQSVIQLFDNKRTLFHNANVIDYPEKNERAILLTSFSNESATNLVNSVTNRFNQIYFPGNDDSLNLNKTPNLENNVISDFLYYNIQSTNNYLVKNTACFGSRLSFNPGFRKNKKNIHGIALLCNAPIASGVSMQNLLERYYYSFSGCDNMDKNLGLYIANAAHDNMAIEILPCSSMNGSIMFSSSHKLITKSKNMEAVKILWDGYGLQSWCLDEADLLYGGDLKNSSSVFLDFTMFSKSKELNYFGNDTISPYKLLTASLFEAFSNEVMPEIYSETDKTILAYDLCNVFDRVRLQTASDFFWDPSSYDPDLSLYRALVNEFGSEAVVDLLRFNDEYFKVRSELILSGNQKNKHRHIRRLFLQLDELKLTADRLKEINLSGSQRELNRIIGGLINELDNKSKAFTRPPLLNLKNYQP